MPKNLEEKFRLFCNSKNLNLNQNQILTIKKLQDFIVLAQKRKLSDKKNFSESLIFHWILAL